MHHQHHQHLTKRNDSANKSYKQMRDSFFRTWVQYGGVYTFQIGESFTLCLQRPGNIVRILSQAGMNHGVERDVRVQILVVQEHSEFFRAPQLHIYVV